MTAGEPPRRTWLAVGVSFAAIVMIGGFSLYVLRLMGTIEEQNTSIHRMQRLTGALGQILDTQQYRIVQLRSPTSDSPSAKIIWSAEHSTLILRAHTLEPPPPSMMYQLWVSRNTITASAGVFPPGGDAGEFLLFEMPALLSQDGSLNFSVSLEPAGGSPQPSGDIVLHSLAK